jgi:hypothetical protein
MIQEFRFKIQAHNPESQKPPRGGFWLSGSVVSFKNEIKTVCRIFGHGRRFIFSVLVFVARQFW